MKRNTPVLSRGLVSVVACVALVLGLMPLPAFAVGQHEADEATALTAPTRSDDEIEEAIRAMIGAGDFVEGEAIVCSLPARTGDAGALDAQSEADSLLAAAEGLSSVTAQTYAEATGETVPAGGASAELAVQAADEPVEIALVHKDGMSTEELLRALLHDSRVLSAEPNYLMGFESEAGSDEAVGVTTATAATATTTAATAITAASDATQSLKAGLTVQATGDDVIETSPDLTSYQWFSNGTASTVPQYSDATNPGVKAPDWNDPTKTNAAGVVAILDSGVDYNHPDLKNVMYEFSDELQAELGCGKYGYAPGREDKTDPMDGLNHGTHCAGIVAAQWNDFGVSGIANGVKICAVSIAKSIENSNYSYDSIIKGYDFIIRAVKAGVDIRAVNRSLGCSPVNNANQAMIQAAGEVGVVTCEASGNESKSIEGLYDDVSVLQPSPYVIRVNAAKPQDKRVAFSNVGKYTTDLFAPGTAILSTIPSWMEGQSRYFPQADSNPLYLETDFDGELFDVFFDSSGSGEGEGSTPKPHINAVTRGEFGADGDGKSLKVDVTVPVAETSPQLCLDVPINSLNKDDVQDIGIAIYGGSGDVTVRGTPYSQLRIQLEDGTYSSDEAVDNTVFGCSGGWCYGNLHIADPAKLTQDFKRVTDSHGRTCIRLRISPQIEVDGKDIGETADVKLYIDQISIGKRGNSGFLPYQYMNGTSMATPVVTGCAAVVSSGITGVSPDVRAAQTVRKLKGAVRQTQGYRDLCKQGGQVDLSLLAGVDGLVPVIESAHVTSSNLTVRGAYFGEKGVVNVGGAEAKVLSWSDTSITVQWPQGVESGLVPISVKASSDAEGCRAFILSAPKTGQGGVDLFERDLTPIGMRPDGVDIMDAPQCLTATDDGVLFAAVADGNDQPEATVRNVMRSDDQGASWTPVEFPVPLKNVSFAVGEGTLYIWGATPADDPVMIKGWHLYGMDISTNTIKHLRDYTYDDVAGIGPIAYVNGNLFFIYSETEGDGVLDAWSNFIIVHFESDYSFGDEVMLNRKYTPYSFMYGPAIAVVGNSLYVCGLVDEMPNGKTAGNLHGLERADINADGSMLSVDLSAALDGLGNDITLDDVCMAASDQGVFLIGDGLEGLLPKGSQAPATDTYLLKPGATKFDAYPRTLSYAPAMRLKGVVSNGWLYAYGISKYEDTSVFGRATRLSADKPAPIDIAKAAITVAKATYTGKPLTPEVSVKLDGKVLAAGVDYDVAYANNVNAGTGVAIVTGKGAYAGSADATFAIDKRANTMTAKAKPKNSTLKASAKKLKKKNVTIAKSKAFVVSQPVGKVTFKLDSVSKKAKGKVTVSSSGKITLKKGLAKGTHKLKVKVNAAGDANTQAKTVDVSLKIKVK